MNIQEQIYKKINDYDTIIIHRHQRPDPDAIGSQIGLSSILKKNFPNKQIYVVGKKIDGLSWIGDPDKVDENKFQNALIFVLDTANKPRIDDNRWQKGSYIIKIDHHPEDDVFGDLSLVNVKASSTSEILVDFCRKFRLKFTYQAVKSFYAGIVGDTGRFLYSNTTSHTMEDVSFLMSAREDLDFTKINRCECEINLSLARLVSYVYENLVITKYGLGYIILKKDILNKFDLENCGTSSIVPLPGNLKEINSWIIFEENTDGSYRVRLRSKKVFINDIAKKHRGGGHPLASGAKAKNETEINQIISEVNDLLKEEKLYDKKI
ncbi:MAG: bifunctional oligoribonuclease/PAP phosphatase NrnA [Firmicutes bacterium]|uniref:Bifunctional oligoribonuclease/PAP phosphatase NrnA n=1 Tax=Candidatus Gallilactobacillus intestinavium TaxID=2840838 RepID=A0A9D9H7Y5_9LACO|nr:bifunctional oligoribonuclease/PAP phosphatase NrnA [Candidatus Gallilactobacillus intestinavium]